MNRCDLRIYERPIRTKRDKILKRGRGGKEDTVLSIDNVERFNDIEFYTEIRHLVKIEIHTSS